jgi:superfamily II DNA/RNA helicase
VTRVSPAIPSFSQLGVPERLLPILAADGKTTPFPIQVGTLPDTLAGRDVLGRGKTGSGKTLAFSIPMVVRLAARRATEPRRASRPIGLILAPTRELATQINVAIEPMAAVYGLNTTTVFGGVSQQRQVDALRRGVDILVACPGRLEDLMRQHAVSLDAVSVTVIDEADHMADLGFLPGVTRILRATPAGGQRLLFSATLDNGVDVLVKQFLRNQVLHSVDDAHSPVAAMTHHVFLLESVEEKKRVITALASGAGRRILFMRTKHQAKKLAKTLTTLGIPAVDLQGNLSQPKRERHLELFATGAVRVLVATDVAARGVHVDDVELVVHVDPPTEHKAYLHRSGRTARAGSEGDVVTLVLPEERKDVSDLLRKAAIRVTPQMVKAESAPVAALVGTLATRMQPDAAMALVAPIVAPPPPPRGGAAQQPRPQQSRQQPSRPVSRAPQPARRPAAVPRAPMGAPATAPHVHADTPASPDGPGAAPSDAGVARKRRRRRRTARPGAGAGPAR